MIPIPLNPPNLRKFINGLDYIIFGAKKIKPKIFICG